MILAPLVKDRKGEHKKVFDDIRKAGFVRVRVNGEIYDVNEDIRLDRYKQTSIEAVVDRIVVKNENNDDTRLADSLETALNWAKASCWSTSSSRRRMAVLKSNGSDAAPEIEGDISADVVFSEQFSCPYDNISLGEIEPRTFSFNTPHGVCPACMGLGTQLEIDPDLIIPNRELSLEDDGAIRANGMDSGTDSD